MSRITYCSIEEAWGLHNNIPKNPPQKAMETNINTITKNEENSFKGKSQMDYEKLKDDNMKMKKMIDEMNTVERNKVPENNINEDYNHYRFNPVNKVNSLYADEKAYTPFQEDMEKKYMQDRLTFLENEFRKYKMGMKVNPNEEDVIEGFENNNPQSDIMDLIVLIILGLIIIFVMDSLFKLGKYIGGKNNG
jgi:hypothetical protein